MPMFSLAAQRREDAARFACCRQESRGERNLHILSHLRCQESKAYGSGDSTPLKLTDQDTFQFHLSPTLVQHFILELTTWNHIG